MPFLTPLVLRPHNQNDWRLCEELHYGTKRGHLIKIPVGFVTDLASIPRIFRLLFPVNGRHRQAAVLHDFLYERRGVFRDKRNEPHTKIQWSRKQCDELFYLAMLETGVPLWKAKVMYIAVRLGGFIPWKT